MPEKQIVVPTVLHRTADDRRATHEPTESILSEHPILNGVPMLPGMLGGEEIVVVTPVFLPGGNVQRRQCRRVRADGPKTPGDILDINFGGAIGQNLKV